MTRLATEWEQVGNCSNPEPGQLPVEPGAKDEKTGNNSWEMLASSSLTLPVAGSTSTT